MSGAGMQRAEAGSWELSKFFEINQTELGALQV